MQWSTWHLHTARCACLLPRAAVHSSACAGPLLQPLLTGSVAGVHPMHHPPFARITAPSTDAGGHELRLGPVLPPLPQERPLRGRHCSRLQVIEGSTTAVEDGASFLAAAVLPTGYAASYAPLPTRHLALFMPFPVRACWARPSSTSMKTPPWTPHGTCCCAPTWAACLSPPAQVRCGWPWSGCGG